MYQTYCFHDGLRARLQMTFSRTESPSFYSQAHLICAICQRVRYVKSKCDVACGAFFVNAHVAKNNDKTVGDLLHTLKTFIFGQKLSKNESKPNLS